MHNEVPDVADAEIATRSAGTVTADAGTAHVPRGFKQRRQPTGELMTARQTAIAAIADPQGRLHAGLPRSTPAQDIYGQYVFHEDAQRQYLAKPIFRKLRRTIEGHEPFDPAIVDAVAHGVKEWAMAHGATHYTHWFVPDDRLHGREARLVPEPDRRRPDHRRVLRQEPRPGRAGRVARSRRAASGPRSRPAATPRGT